MIDSRKRSFINSLYIVFLLLAYDIHDTALFYKKLEPVIRMSPDKFKIFPNFTWADNHCFCHVTAIGDRISKTFRVF